MVRLEPKSASDLATWLPEMWSDYRAHLLEAGFSDEEASSNIERNTAALFVDEKPNDEQRFFNVRSGDTIVGSLWLAKRSPESTDVWFVYDIVIEAAHRGKGLGRDTMLAAEDYVRSQGGTRLELNVFGPNVIARTLYESLGYQATAIMMRKDLP